MADPSSSTLTRYFAPSLEEENGGRVVAVDYHVHIERDVKRILAFQDAEIARLRERAEKAEAMVRGLPPTFAAGLLVKLKEECEAQHARAESLSARLALVTEALQSIANNSCCGPCQEAKRVAQRALCQADRAVDVR